MKGSEMKGSDMKGSDMKDMNGKVKNFKRLYAGLNRLPYCGEVAELKECMVLQYTNGRTRHVSEMTQREYDMCCLGVERAVRDAGAFRAEGSEGVGRTHRCAPTSGADGRMVDGASGADGRMVEGAEHLLRMTRSKALHLMQKCGVDTGDWGRVNGFCRDARICGKEFYVLDVDELEVLCKKLRAIFRKGGVKMKERVGDGGKTVYVMVYANDVKGGLA